LALWTLWGAKNVAATGCLLYPESRTCIDALPWAMPSERVDTMRNLIRVESRAWATALDELHGGASWLRGVATHLGDSVAAAQVTLLIVPILASLFGVGLLLLGWAWRSPRTSDPTDDARGRTRTLSMLLAVNLGGAVFCAGLAPEPRYAYGYWLSASILIFAFGWFSAVPLASVDRTARFTSRLFWVCVVVACIGVVWKARVPATRWPRAAPTQGQRRVVGDGISVWTPNRGYCWNLPIPCAAPFHANLRARRVFGGRMMFWQEGPVERPGRR
jgi:hypothetical protein